MKYILMVVFFCVVVGSGWFLGNLIGGKKKETKEDDLDLQDKE